MSATSTRSAIFPAGRYGRRREDRRTPRLTVVLAAVLVAAVALGIAWSLYRQYGDAQAEATVQSFRTSDHGVRIVATVSKPADRAATCLLRARDRAGVELGTAEVAVPAHRDRIDFTLLTAGRPVTGEAVSCRLDWPADPVGLSGTDGFRSFAASLVRSKLRPSPRSTAVSTDAEATWLSQDAYDRLQRELDDLVAARPAVAAEINARREEGDLRENGGYHAAREEQGKQEGRISYLKQFLQKAKVGEAPRSDSVAPGMVVTIQFDGDPNDAETFLLGSREIAATTDLTVYSPESALGQAIVGQPAGTTVTYTAPNGNEISVKIDSFKPYEG